MLAIVKLKLLEHIIVPDKLTSQSVHDYSG